MTMNKPARKIICCLCCVALTTCCALLACGCSNKDRSAVVNGAWKSQGSLAAVAKNTASLSDDVRGLRAYFDPSADEITLAYLDKDGRDLSTFWKGALERKGISDQVPGDIARKWHDAGITASDTLPPEMVGTYREQSDDLSGQGDEEQGQQPAEDETRENDSSTFNFTVRFTASALDGYEYALDSVEFTYNGLSDSLSFELPVGSDVMVQMILERDFESNEAIANGDNPFKSSKLSSGDVQATAEPVDADDSWADGNTVSNPRAIDVLKNNKWDESLKDDQTESEDAPGKTGGRAEEDAGDDVSGAGGDGTVSIDGVIIDQS